MNETSDNPARSLDTSAHPAARTAWEDAKIARAEAERDAGFGITGDDLNTFLNDLERSGKAVKAPAARALRPNT